LRTQVPQVTHNGIDVVLKQMQECLGVGETLLELEAKCRKDIPRDITCKLKAQTLTLADFITRLLSISFSSSPGCNSEEVALSCGSTLTSVS
jgi:hypothetical protein